MNIASYSKNHIFAFLTFLFVLLGFYFRLDQFFIQTLIDDEWHAVHQLLRSNPAKIIHSFGHADYSIPLTLYYWFQAKYFGLSELGMRIPSMLFGLSFLLVFTVFVYKKFSQIEALVFSFLLATSPLLIIYSNKARPYAITIFLVYFAIWCFNKYRDSDKKIFYAFLYSISAAFAVWLHLVVAFFVVSPFLLDFIKLFSKTQNYKLKKFLHLVYIGIPTLLLTSILIVPPLLNDMASLAVKSGKDLPTIQTAIGSLYLIFGSKSILVVTFCSLCALLGLPRVLSQSIVFINIMIGFFITIIVIFIAQPAWVNHSVTLLRYLLPIIPLLLLATASGIYMLIDNINRRLNKEIPQAIVLIFCLLLFILYFYYSPVRTFTQSPYTNINHSRLIFDFRDDKNQIIDYMDKRPLSKFWQTLNTNPLTHKIAVAPWYFESYHWDAPRWEMLSKQIIVPGYLIGLCVDKRSGEVPNDKRFRFKNVGYLNNPNNLKQRNIDYIVYQKPSRLKFENLYSNLDKCQQALYNLYGKPLFEDELIKVFTVNISGDSIDKQ